MFRKILLLSIVVFSSLYFVACTDDPSSLGSALLSQDTVGLDSLDSYKDTLAQTSTNYKYVTPLAASQVLLLGKSTANGVTNEAYTLLSYAIGFQDSIKGFILSKKLKILKAVAELDVTYKLGNPVPGFAFTGYKITSGWTASGFTVDSLANLTYESQNLVTTPVFTKNDSVMKFEIDTGLVSNWFTAEADTAIPSDNGIILVPQSNGGVLGFHSLSSSYTSLVPLLSVIVMKDGWAAEDTLKFVPATDLSVVKGSVPSSTELVFIQSSVMLNSVLKFDISKLPEHAIINNAQLELTMDTTASVLGDGYTTAMVGSLFSNTSNPDSSITNSVSLTKAGNLFTGNIASFVQKWLSTKVNNGILLRTADLTKGLETFAIKSSTAADLQVRPRLKIIFTDKK